MAKATRPKTYRSAASSMRRRRARYEVKNLPPPWKRSLTESGMTRKATSFELTIVGLFLITLLGMIVWGCVEVLGWPM